MPQPRPIAKQIKSKKVKDSFLWFHCSCGTFRTLKTALTPVQHTHFPACCCPVSRQDSADLLVLGSREAACGESRPCSQECWLGGGAGARPQGPRRSSWGREVLAARGRGCRGLPLGPAAATLALAALTTLPSANSPSVLSTRSPGWEGDRGCVTASLPRSLSVRPSDVCGLSVSLSHTHLYIRETKKPP